MANNYEYMKFYTPKILLGADVILDVVNEFVGKNMKVLVFGLGHDSKLWYHANDRKNIWFVESNDDYIKLCDYMEPQYVIKYNYSGLTVKNSFTMTQQEIDKYQIPEEILKNAPYDLIIVDGPAGFNDVVPGRLLPIYWSSKYLSKKGTFIYVDDSERKLENFCIKKFLVNAKHIKTFVRVVNPTYLCETSKYLI